MSGTSTDPRNITPPWRPRFGLAGLMLVMLVVSMMAAAAFYLVRALKGGRGWQLAFILFTLVAPIIIGITTSIFREVIHKKFLSKTSRRKRGN